MNRAVPAVSFIDSQRNPTTHSVVDSVEHRCGGEPTSYLINTVGPHRPVSPVRLTLTSQLGNKVDGAWWPRTGVISREIIELIAVLRGRLGRVTDINVNWSSLQSQQDLNWDCWHGIRPHVMTVGGRDARAQLLIVPHRTGAALAVMVLRQAAGLPVYDAHRDSRAFQRADCIVRMARGEQMFGSRRSR
ncbi:DUF5994 family protein [Mycobacterium nebraskense]|nr:DUF5994 family protein [Mycobacterium nebraskense]